MLQFIFRRNTLADLSREYLQYKSLTLAANSIRGYRQIVGLVSGEKRLTREILNTAINQGAHSSRERRRVVLDDFQKWLVREGHQKVVIRTQVTTRRIDQAKQIHVISEAQFLDLISALKDKRIRNVLKVGFYMGLRLNELAHLRPAWVVDDMLRIGDLRAWNLPDERHPKSQKEYDLPIAIPDQVRGVLTNIDKSGADKFRRLFGYRSDSTLQRHLKKRFSPLPDPYQKTFTAHHLRHSCISYWLNEKNVPIQEVQRLARHARIEATMKYYHPDDVAHLKAFS